MKITIKSLLIIIVILLFFQIRSEGQTLLVPEANAFNGRFFRFVISDPGAETTTTCLFFDRKGLLWFGNYAGVYSFDGIEYKYYPVNSSEVGTGYAGLMVNDIFEDRSGNIWIGTNAAVNILNPRTNEIRIIYPDSLNKKSPDNIIRKIYQDKESNIWILTSGDLFRSDPSLSELKCYKTFDKEFLSQNNNFKREYCIIEDSCGFLWIPSDEGLYKYERRRDSLMIYRHSPGQSTGLPANNVSSVLEDKSGRLWCVMDGGGLAEITDRDKGLFRKVDLHANDSYSFRYDSLTTILADSRGRIWVSGYSTISCFDPVAGISKNYYLQDTHELKVTNRQTPLRIRFKSSFEDEDGNIWFLANRQGFLFRLDPETEKIRLYVSPNWVVFNCIMDNADAFWLSVVSGNAWRLAIHDLPYQLLTLPRTTNFIGPPRMASVAEDANGNVWFSIFRALLKTGRVDPEYAFTPDSVTLPDGGKYVYCIYRDRAGSLWFGRPNGIITRLDDAENGIFTNFRLPGASESIHVENIFEDRRGTMWFVSGQAVFYMEKNSTTIWQQATDNVLFNNAMAMNSDVLNDSKERLWVISQPGDLFSYDKRTGEVFFWSQNESSGLPPSGDLCFRIMEDSYGTIWVMYTLDGLFRLDESSGQFIRFSELKWDVRPSNLQYLDFYIDASKLWVSHNHGITKYNLLSGESRHIWFEQKAIRSFFYKLSTGNLIYFAGANIYLFQDSIPSNRVPPPLLITSISINNDDFYTLFPSSDDVAYLDQIVLRKNQNSIKIGFAALNFLEPQRNSYRYYMKGADKDTVITTSSYRFAEYKSLKPGRYTFWFTGSNNDGVWNASGKTIEIRIMPPWYATFLAYALYFIIFVSALVYITKYTIRLRLSKLEIQKTRLEQEVQLRTLELVEKNRMIEESDKLKTRFFTEISHEVRTPLTLISGLSENLLNKNEEFDESGKLRLIEVIRRNSLKLLKLVNQLLDISRIDAGTMKLILGESDILKFIRTLANEFISMGESRNITLTTRIQEDAHVTFFDHNKLEQVINNLIGNAFKFTPAGGSIICTAKIVTRKNPGDRNYILLDISDTGIGIPEEDRDKIFDRFYRIEGHWDKDGSGTGIGLSITKELVRLMHGQIKVFSEQMKGSSFIVEIPLGTEHLKPAEYVIVQAEKENSLPVSPDNTDLFEESSELEPEGKIHILLVEDNNDLRAYIRDNLMNEYQIIEAEDGNKGLNIAFSRIPDLIISDILMPGTDGISLMNRLKKDERTSHIPIIILTARAELESKLEALDKGADEYLIKPFNISELKARVSNLLAQRENLRLKYGLLSGYEQPDHQIGNTEEIFVSKVIGIIYRHIHEFEFDVGFLQEKIGMSRSNLYRKLIAITGMSPKQIIRTCRMKHAAKLIRNKAGNLTEIAMSTGFSNPSYFTKCFKEYYGVLPREFNNKPEGETK